MSWVSRLVATLRSRKLDDELTEELRFHLEARAEELVQAGLSPEEATREARRRLGRPLGLRETSREIKLIPWLDSIARDVRFGLHPLFERLREAGRPHVDLFGMSYSWRRSIVFDDSGGQEERVRAQWVSGDAFTLLGVRPTLGRLQTAADDQRPGDHPVAVLSHAFWRGASDAALPSWGVGSRCKKSSSRSWGSRRRA